MPNDEGLPEDSPRPPREWVMDALAVAIVGSTIFCALWSFRFVGEEGQMEDAKALLAAMSGLSGVVIGYYFGRTPGETHAARAQGSSR
jgi:hypothetical protein